MKLLITIIGLIIILFPVNACCQSGSIWYFGGGDATGNPTNDAAGLDFTTSPPSALPGNEGQLISFEGNATLSDNYGNLFFYTDGSSVFDKTHTVMPNGTGLFGNPSSTQSSIVAPVPGSFVEFYVFTNQSLNVGGSPSFHGLSYSKIDMTLAGNGTNSCPLGDVVTGVKNIPLADSTSEKTTIVPHSNGIDYWVVFQGSPWNQITSLLVTSAGVNVLPATPVISASPYWGGILGEMKSSPNGNYLALGQIVLRNPALPLPGAYVMESELQLLGFDPGTGALIPTNCFKLDSITAGTFGFYGVEFSSSGDYLYANNDPLAELYQFDMNAANISTSKINIGIGVQGSLQLAPNGKIYQARANNNSLDVINDPNLAGLGCGFVALGQTIGTGVCKTGLPNSPVSSILSSVFSNYIVNDTTICNGDSVSIGSLIKPNHTYAWSPVLGLNDPTIANPLAAPSVTTTYYLLAEYRCDTILDSITITVNSVIPVPVIDTIGSICTNVNAILTTTAQSGGTINWYSDAGLIINVGVGPVLNLGNVTTPGEHIYYATETVGGCESAGVSYIFWTSECTPYPCATNLLTNGDFENYISCPDDGFSIYQDSAVTVTNWQNGIIDIVSGSNLTPDYFNTNCSYSNTANYTAPYPSPNGSAYAGFISTAPFGSPNKEMLGMMYDLKECQEYSLQLKIVQGETLLLPGALTTDIVIYGGVSGGLPLLSPTICPLAQGFEIMGTIPAGSIDSLWRTFDLTFSPSGNYDCFIIGADCTNPSTGFDAILVDDVFLCVDPCVNMATNILPINLASDTCSSNTGSGSVDFTTNCYTGFDFVWLDGALNTVSTDSMAIGLAAGTYTVQVTDSNNCMIDATVVIPNISSFVVTLTTNSPICENQLLSLSAFPSGLSAGSYSWVGPNGPFGGAGLSTVDIIPIGNPIAGGWYYVTVDDGTCTGVDSAFVISNSTYNIFDTIAICSGTNYTYADGTISNNIIVDESHISSLTTVESCDSIVREFLVVGTNAAPVIVTPNSWYCVGDNIADLITITGDIWYSDVSLATQVGTGASFTPPSTVGVTNYYVVDTTGGCFSLPDSIAIEFVNCITCVGNLVPNPGFETNTGLPSALGQYNLVDNWSNSGGPTAFSADYFHTNGIGVAQLPTTSLLTSMPNSGNATMGAIIYSFASNYREYINVQLTSPLIVGTTYDVSFYVTAGQFNGNAGGTGANNIGAHFSVGAITQPAGSAPFNIAPVFNYNTVFYDSNWVQMSFQYTATTPVDYLTVGNFYDDAGTTTIIYDPLSSGFNQAIIMYDDFCVTAVSVPISGYTVSDTAFCEGTCITITDASTLGNTWEWTFNGGTPATSIIQNPGTVCFNAAGIYTIEQIVTNSFGSDTTTSTVEVFPSPIIDTGAGVTLELGGSTTLNATGGGANAVYTWDPADWLTCIECSTTIATPEETITYTVSVVDSSGCVATNDVTIIVNYDNVVWTPNIFSANGDGLNDVFYVRGPIQPENFTLIIYSRWGEKIFETTDPTLGWDGTFKGKPLNTAVFAYIATGSTSGGSDFELKGNITLIVK